MNEQVLMNACSSAGAFIFDFAASTHRAEVHSFCFFSVGANFKVTPEYFRTLNLVSESLIPIRVELAVDVKPSASVSTEVRLRLERLESMTRNMESLVERKIEEYAPTMLDTFVAKMDKRLDTKLEKLLQQIRGDKVTDSPSRKKRNQGTSGQVAK